MTTLYGRANAWNVRKVMFLAEEIGLELNRLDYGRGYTPTDTAEFLSLNPMGLVPVLKDGPTVLAESHTILRYLAAKYAAPSYYPSALDQRGVVDQWLDWKLGHVSPPVRLLFFHHYLKTPGISEDTVSEAEEESAKLFTVLDGQLARTGAYVAGEDLTIADCAVGMAVHRWLNLPLRRPELAHVQRYYGQLSGRPAFQKTILTGMP